MASLSHRLRVAFFAFALGLLAVSAAGAQTLGTFTWQLQPNCNVVHLTVTQVGGVFRLDGYDDLCDLSQRSSAVGVAFPNPDGTIGIGLSIVVADSGKPVHVDAVISLATLSGTWRDSDFGTGTFAFGGSASGMVRGSLDSFNFTVSENTPATVLVGRVNGTREAPLSVQSGQPIGAFAFGGQAGDSFQITSAFVGATATENWSANAGGARLQFFTTANGTLNAGSRMTINHDGNVGIGENAPLDRLDVNGHIRIGTSGTNGCVKNNSGNPLVGTCASDARFKRDITPFAPALDAVAKLRPVHYYWRSDEFPQQGFGPAQAYGLIAQEAEEVLPELVTTGEDGYKAVDYSKLPLLTLQAVRELKQENDRLKAENAAFERRLAALEARHRH